MDANQIARISGLLKFGRLSAIVVVERMTRREEKAKAREEERARRRRNKWNGRQCSKGWTRKRRREQLNRMDQGLPAKIPGYQTKAMKLEARLLAHRRARMAKRGVGGDRGAYRPVEAIARARHGFLEGMEKQRWYTSKEIRDSWPGLVQWGDFQWAMDNGYLERWKTNEPFIVWGGIQDFFVCKNKLVRWRRTAAQLGDCRPTVVNRKYRDRDYSFME